MLFENTNQEFDIHLDMPRLSIDGVVQLQLNLDVKDDIEKGHNQGSIYYNLIFSKDENFICEIPFKLMFDEYTPEAITYPGAIQTRPSIVSKIVAENYSLNPNFEEHSTDIINFIQLYKESGQKIIPGSAITDQQIEELIGFKL